MLALQKESEGPPRMVMKPGCRVDPVRPVLTSVAPMVPPASPVKGEQETVVEATEAPPHRCGTSDRDRLDAWLAIHGAMRTPVVSRGKRMASVCLPKAVLIDPTLPAPPGVDAVTRAEFHKRSNHSTGNRIKSGNVVPMFNKLNPQAVKHVIRQHAERVAVWEPLIELIVDRSVTDHEQRGGVFKGMFEEMLDRKAEQISEQRYDMTGTAGIPPWEDAVETSANDSVFDSKVVSPSLFDSHVTAMEEHQSDVLPFFTRPATPDELMYRVNLRSKLKRKHELEQAFEKHTPVEAAVTRDSQSPVDIKLVKTRAMLQYKCGNYLRYYSREEFLRDYAGDIQFMIELAPSSIRAFAFDQRCQARRYKLRALARINNPGFKPSHGLARNKTEFFRQDPQQRPLSTSVSKTYTASQLEIIADKIIRDAIVAKQHINQMTVDAKVSLGLYEFKYMPSGLYMPVDDIVVPEGDTPVPFDFGW